MCDNFARELSKIVVAQICKETGFQAIQECALETLCDVLQKCEFSNSASSFITRYGRNRI